MGLPFKSERAGGSTGDCGGEEALSVSELVGCLKETLKLNFSDLLVAGELVSFKRHDYSGHCYFTLGDDASAIDAVMWRGAAQRLGFEPQSGDEVLCRGYIDVYEKQGRMQLYVTSMRPLGAGAAQRALEQLRKKLEAEGLFDPARKRPLPFMPRTIGIVTSRSGAAIDDILTTLHRRFPGVHVLLSPAAVQGDAAPTDLVRALALLEADGRADVVIFGRGGGAAEDLAAFNDERVVRAVVAHRVPVVSAVGHEMDTSLCDLAADLRAATPTAAGEAVVPVLSDVRAGVADLDTRLGRTMLRRVGATRDRVGAVRGRLRDPISLLARARQRADELAVRLERALGTRYRQAVLSKNDAAGALARAARAHSERLSVRLRDLQGRLQKGLGDGAWRTSSRLTSVRSRLNALSPLAVLERGYSLAMTPEGKPVRSSAEIASGDILTLRFHRGGAHAAVVDTSEDNQG